MDFGVYEFLVDEYKAVVWFNNGFICMDQDYNITIRDCEGEVLVQHRPTKQQL